MNRIDDVHYYLFTCNAVEDFLYIETFSHNLDIHIEIDIDVYHYYDVDQVVTMIEIFDGIYHIYELQKKVSSIFIL